jgi:hypothetical protein
MPTSACVMRADSLWSAIVAGGRMPFKLILSEFSGGGAGPVQKPYSA